VVIEISVKHPGVENESNPLTWGVPIHLAPLYFHSTYLIIITAAATVGPIKTPSKISKLLMLTFCSI
jgi:hypothetical protein